MKKFFIVVLTVASALLVLQAKVHAYCLASSESGDPFNVYSLPYMVAEPYNGLLREVSLCTASPFDRWLGFEQAVRFATEEAGYDNNVNNITLNSPLIFNNPAVNLVVGNLAQAMLDDPNLDPSLRGIYGRQYTRDVITVPQDVVTIDARTNFTRSQLPFTCMGGTQSVYFRNILLKTNGVTRDELFRQLPCIRNGGNFVVEPEESGGGVIVCTTCFTPAGEHDNDGDGYCPDANGDGRCWDADVRPGDCDDSNNKVHPGATEHCNGIDDDCDGLSDREEGLGTTFYRDADGDRHGDPFVTTVACTMPWWGYVSDPNDCDDSRSNVYAGATEICDGLDNDCDYAVDDGLVCPVVPPGEIDNDGDGYCEDSNGDGICRDSTRPGDCDDTNFYINPNAAEICTDSVDNDCDGNVNEGCSTPPPPVVDDDGDGYCEGTAPCTDGSIPGDCNDSNGTVHPGANEICENGVDENCDGNDEECTDPGTVCTGGTAPRPWYIDADGDGYGVLNVATLACERPSGYSALNTECNDQNAGINPVAEEVCGDFTDNDCDGRIDEGCNGSAGTDDDNDGFCEMATTCSDGSLPGDCDDTNSEINPGITEDCDDTTDNNCDGETDIDDVVCQIGGEPPPPDPETPDLLGPLEGGAISGCSLDVGQKTTISIYITLVLLAFIPLILVCSARFVTGKRNKEIFS